MTTLPTMKEVFERLRADIRLDSAMSLHDKELLLEASRLAEGTMAVCRHLKLDESIPTDLSEPLMREQVIGLTKLCLNASTVHTEKTAGNLTRIWMDVWTRKLSLL